MADHVENLEKLRNALVEYRRELVATWIKRKPAQFGDQLGALDDSEVPSKQSMRLSKTNSENVRRKKRAASPDFTTDPDA